MRRAIPFTALILVAALVLSGFSSQEIVVGRRRAATSSLTVTLFVSNGNFGASPTATVGLTGLATSDFLVIFSIINGTTLTLNTPSGCGTVFTSRGSPPGSGSPIMGVWTSPSTTTGSCTVTQTSSSSGSAGINLLVYAVHGSTKTFDAISTYETDTGFCTSCTGQAVSTGGSNHMALFFGWNNGSVTISALSPYTTDQNSVKAGSGQVVIGGSYLKAASGSVTPTWTSSGAHYADVSIAVY